MTRDLDRRDFLKASAALAGAAAANAFSCVEIASAAPIEVPVIDRLTIRVLVDSSFDQFLRPKQANGVSHNTVVIFCDASWRRSRVPKSAN